LLDSSRSDAVDDLLKEVMDVICRYTPPSGPEIARVRKGVFVSRHIDEPALLCLPMSKYVEIRTGLVSGLHAEEVFGIHADTWRLFRGSEQKANGLTRMFIDELPPHAHTVLTMV
jgi:hypothetical protein